MSNQSFTSSQQSTQFMAIASMILFKSKTLLMQKRRILDRLQVINVIIK